jgi:hypothetical protein
VEVQEAAAQATQATQAHAHAAKRVSQQQQPERWGLVQQQRVEVQAQQAPQQAPQQATQTARQQRAAWRHQRRPTSQAPLVQVDVKGQQRASLLQQGQQASLLQQGQLGEEAPSRQRRQRLRECGTGQWNRLWENETGILHAVCHTEAAHLQKQTSR